MPVPPHDPPPGPPDAPAPPRRRWLQRAAGLTAAGVLVPMAATPARAALAPMSGSRDLALAHLHTRERLALVYAVDDRFVPDALGTLNHFLRDHYSGDVGEMDPQLYELLHRVRRVLGSGERYEVISGYRAPATNANLRATRGGGVAQGSLHTQGRAIDVRLPGVALADLRDAALSLRAGGVGFYPRENFVHIDTGRVRRW